MGCSGTGCTTGLYIGLNFFSGIFFLRVKNDFRERGGIGGGGVADLGSAYTISSSSS